MTPRDWFTLSLRVLGIWKLLGAIDSCTTVFEIRTGVWIPDRTPVSVYVTHFATALVAGTILLTLAPRISYYVCRSKSS